jgi:hypothetical protein
VFHMCIVCKKKEAGYFIHQPLVRISYGRN